MDWDKLRIFHAVAEAGSFTHAGEKLNLSQSAVSRQISTLEDSLGISLFHRHARGLLMTEEGEILHKAATDIISKLSMIEGQLSDSRQLAEGPLRVTVAEFVGSTLLAPRIGAFQREHRDIQLSVILEDRILNLGMREADAGIRLYESDQQDLIQRHLKTIQFHMCASKDYLSKFGRPDSEKDLKSHNLIGFPDGVPAPFSDPNWLLHTAKVDIENNPRILMINSIQGMFHASISGAGIACLPDYMIAQDKSLEIVLPQIQRPGVDMYFVYSEERRNSRRIAAFRDFLVKSLSENAF